jgi:hypothetical protein
VGLFDWFRRKKVEPPVNEEVKNGHEIIKSREAEAKIFDDLNDRQKQIEIPREIFIEEVDPIENQLSNTTSMSLNGEFKGIERVYEFLQADYEKKGYEDARENPDENYKTESVKLFRMDLEIYIQQAEIYYQDFTKEIDVHIAIRERAGLVDLVQELKARREIIDYRRNILAEIKSEVEKEEGKFMRLKLSYQRGFLKGLTELTNLNVLNKKIF